MSFFKCTHSICVQLEDIVFTSPFIFFTFQALAASGGMSAVNMLVGFLSGYAGSHSNNNNKCCNNLDAVREAVRALQESNAELVAKVKIVEQQMSNVTTSGVSRLE